MIPTAPSHRRARRVLLSLALLGGALLSSTALAADVFRHVDQDGVLVISNVAPGKTRRGVKTTRTRDGITRITASSPGPYVPAIKGGAAGYLPHIEEACTLYRIPKALALAVMAAESNFDPTVISHAGASGLMQLMPATAAEMFVNDIFDPRQNIHGGVRYLRVLANMFAGDMVQIVAAYNAGPDAVRRAGGAIPNIAETQGYVRKVLRFYFAYKKEHPDADPDA